MADSPTQFLASFSAGLQFDDIPVDVAHEVKRLLLDTLACGLGGLGLDKGSMALAWARQSGGTPQATVFGTRTRLPAAQVWPFPICERWPQRIASMLIDRVRKELADGYDIERHFTPPYKPWDQRLCLVADGDLFEAINSGRVEVVTDHIERFTSDGILLKSGREISADIIITATGLLHKMMAGVDIRIDGEAFASDQALSQAALQHLLEHEAQRVAVAEPSMPVL